jgi:hypothetical protein
MSEDHDDFFAAPPADPTASFDNDDAAPIVLGDPQPGSFDSSDAYNQQQSHIGDIHEAPSTDDAPILLGSEQQPSSYDDYPIDHVNSNDSGAPPAADDDAFGLVATSTEPSPMQVWNAEWQELLLVRKQEEDTRKKELADAAQEIKAQMQVEREQKREAKMGKNREDEQAKLEAIEADLENDNSWQRVCKMVELSHDSSQKTADVKRMRDLLIKLKNDTSKAVELSA